MREAANRTLDYADASLSRPGVRSGRFAAFACVLSWLLAAPTLFLGFVTFTLTSRWAGALFFTVGLAFGLAGCWLLRFAVMSNYGREPPKTAARRSVPWTPGPPPPE